MDALKNLPPSCSHSLFIQIFQFDFGRKSYTDKKENQIFLIYKEIQSVAVAKSYMRKGLPNI